MKLPLNLQLIILSTLLLAGCATAPTTTGPTPLADVDTAVHGALKAINTLNVWTYDHRGQLKVQPALRAPLKELKARVWNSIEAATKQRDAFANKPESLEARAKLDEALAELNMALDATAKFLAERAVGK